jgi:hypothetical protein
MKKWHRQGGSFGSLSHGPSIAISRARRQAVGKPVPLGSATLFDTACGAGKSDPGPSDLAPQFVSLTSRIWRSRVRVSDWFIAGRFGTTHPIDGLARPQNDG